MYKKLILIAIICTIGLGLSAQIVPDDNFRIVINEHLGQPDIYQPTIEDLNILSGTLSARGSGISSIEGAQYLTDLEYLDLYNNQVSDISALSGLTNLETLNLFNNQVSDISALSGLTNLWHLNLFNNQVSDISGLTDLPNLLHLDLNHNQISSAELTGLTNLLHLYLNSNQIISAELTGLTNLIDLQMKYNQISDISGLTDLPNLTHLSLNHNQIISAELTGLTNLEHLSLNSNQIISAELTGLTNLNSLDMDNNQIIDISGLTDLPNLNSLRLCDNQISDISAISGLSNLEWLILGSNQISDISGLTDLPNLTHLYLNDNQISSAELTGLTNLNYLNMDNNHIIDISGLTNLPNLSDLSLASNQISYPELTGLPSLEYLALYGNQIFVISGLSDLPNLHILSLTSNHIIDISGLTNLPSLNALFLNYNQINDISTLSELTNMNRLYLGCNHITDISGLSPLANLTDLDLCHNQITDIAPLVENSGLALGDKLYLHDNPLSIEALEFYVPILESRPLNFIGYDDEANLNAACYPYPIRHAENVAYNMILYWQGAESATNYEVYLGTSNTELVSIGLGEHLGANTFASYPELLPSTEYWWKIKSTNQNEELWSGMWHFYTGYEYGFDANFVVSNTIVSINEEIQFTDLSIGNPTSWEWDFQNDGVIDSNEQSPFFTYTGEGIYSVSLTVSDGINYNTETKIDYIFVNPPTGVNPDVLYENVLMSNFPNPFNPSTTIKFSVKEGETANLQIFNLNGQIVKSYPFFSVGNHLTEWNGEDNEGDKVSSGVYFYKLKSESTTKVRKMLMLK